MRPLKRLLMSAFVSLAFASAAAAATFNVSGSGGTPGFSFPSAPPENTPYNFSVTFDVSGPASFPTYSNVSGALNISGFGTLRLLNAGPNATSRGLITVRFRGPPDFVDFGGSTPGFEDFSLEFRNPGTDPIASITAEDFLDGATYGGARFSYIEGRFGRGASAIGDTGTLMKVDPAVIPVPAAGLLLLSGLAAFGFVRRRTLR